MRISRLTLSRKSDQRDDYLGLAGDHRHFDVEANQYLLFDDARCQR